MSTSLLILVVRDSQITTQVVKFHSQFDAENAKTKILSEYNDIGSRAVARVTVLEGTA